MSRTRKGGTRIAKPGPSDMVRARLAAVFAVCAGLGFGTSAAVADEAMMPPGGLWQSIPYESERTPVRTEIASLPQSKLAPKMRPRRHPVPAAAVPERAPRASAAARAKELDRRLGVLMPGTKLGANIANPYAPAWRRAHPGRPAGEDNSLSLPFDDSGRAGFLARGYHAQPDVQNPHGNTGATFGLRQRF